MPSVQWEEHADLTELPMGELDEHWEVTKKLGEGAFGAVYLLEERKSRALCAAKIASNSAVGGGMLKNEFDVLKRLDGRTHVPQLIAGGKIDHSCVILMTLLGPSLSTLFKECGCEFSVSTQLRVGLQILFGLKQLHEIGFIHRDVKPANLAIGCEGEGARMVHLLDFGLAREFVLRKPGRVKLRKPRLFAQFCGTRRYASLNAHKGVEQGRSDDLWSMMYVLAEMRAPLPWHQLRTKEEIAASKAATSDARLFQHSPRELYEMTVHLRTLDYAKRPRYANLYCLLTGAMVEHDVRYSDPFDWELRGVSTSAGDASANGTYPPFTADDLAKNELGF